MSGLSSSEFEEIKAWRENYCEERGKYLRSLQASLYTPLQIKQILDQDEKRKEKA